MNRKLSQAVKHRSGGSCEARVACRRAVAIHMHHRRRAGRVDSVENLVHVCLNCHDWIHANPEQSYELGLLVHSWDDPVTVPVIPLPSAGRAQGSSPETPLSVSAGPAGGDLPAAVVS